MNSKRVRFLGFVIGVLPFFAKGEPLSIKQVLGALDRVAQKQAIAQKVRCSFRFSERLGVAYSKARAEGRVEIDRLKKEFFEIFDSDEEAAKAFVYDFFETKIRWVYNEKGILVEAHYGDEESVDHLDLVLLGRLICSKFFKKIIKTSCGEHSLSPVFIKIWTAYFLYECERFLLENEDEEILRRVMEQGGRIPLLSMFRLNPSLREGFRFVCPSINTSSVEACEEKYEAAKALLAQLKREGGYLSPSRVVSEEERLLWRRSREYGKIIDGVGHLGLAESIVCAIDSTIQFDFMCQYEPCD